MFPIVVRSMDRRVAASAVSALAFLCAGPATSQTVLWQVQAIAPCTAFGEDVLSAGDFDGDGLQDLLVGEPGFNPGGIANAGRVTIWSGATQQLLFSFAGTLPGGGLGAVLGRPGDLTGDGIPDVVVARVSGGTGLSPPPSLRSHHVVVISGSGAPVAYYNGESAAAVGDLDGDGLGDLVVGQPVWYDPTCFGWVGRAYALSGATGPLLAQWLGVTPCETLGIAVEPLGDITGDGVPEFAVGSRGHSVFGGFVTAFSGVGPYFALFASGPPAPYGGSTGFGSEIALAGDVDADGVDDILTGAPWDGGIYLPPLLPPPGKAYVISGASGLTLHAFTGYFDLQYFGRAVGRLGDLDGDGHADLLIGGPFSAPWHPNWVCLAATASVLGRAYVFSGRTGLKLLELVESPPGEGFGSSLDGLGDLDGDEYPDFAAGEPWRGFWNPGRVLAYSGAPIGVTVFGSACAGSGGHLPRIASWPVAATGSTVALNLSRALGDAPAVLLLGFSNASWSGVPLPLSLGAFGMPSCSLLVAPTFAFPVRTQGTGAGKGKASIPLSVPSDPLFVGAAFYAQWYVVDPGPSPLPGVTSRGLRVTIQ